MPESAEGPKILEDRPRINIKTSDMDKLDTLSENTFGETPVRTVTLSRMSSLLNTRIYSFRFATSPIQN